MKPLNAIALAAISLVSVGCANFNSVHRELKINEGAGALIDIKQRAIFVSKDTKAPFGAVVCAEPSPDALSAYAAELAARATVPGKGSGELSSAFQESSAFIGLRTQTIQLLRDSRYRDCEAYMNGALDQSQYEFQARRHQKLTVALMAIEQLTGSVLAPPVTISTAGSAEAARSIVEMRAELTEIDKAIADLEKKKVDQSDDEKKKTDEKIKLLQGDKDAIAKGIENARGMLATGSASSTISNVGVPTQRSDQHIQIVTNAVERIVQSIINTSDLGQLCFEFMQRDIEKLPNSAKQLQTMCGAYFQVGDLQATLDSLKVPKTEDSPNSKNTDAQKKKLAEQMKELLDKMKTLKLPTQ